MFSLIAYAANIIFHSVVIVDQYAVERWKHYSGYVWVHQEQHDYHSWYQVASELISRVLLNLTHDWPEDYAYYQQQHWLKTIHYQLLEEYWDAIIFSIRSHQEAIEWKDLTRGWCHCRFILFEFLNLTWPLIVYIRDCAQNLNMIREDLHVSWGDRFFFVCAH